MLLKDPFFNSFESSVDSYAVPEKFTFHLSDAPVALCLLAAKELQNYLTEQTDFQHNFGLANDTGTVIGKMFGVLLVKTKENEIGYLAAFSGKLADTNHHAKFVPPVFDALTENSFLNNGMTQLKQINNKISALESQENDANIEQVNLLKISRKNHSIALQNELFKHYHFLNKSGEEKSLHELFKNANYNNPPSAAGECAAPKLLQYSFQNKMQPLAIAEFWWGKSPKSNQWKHKHFYPCCREKCEPILAHMLFGINE